jgi:hypothetical protein
MSKKAKHRSPANSRASAEQRRLANLEKGRRYRFVPGQSGNPSGRPPAIFAKECRDKLSQLVPGDPLKRSYAKYFANYLAHKGMHGDQNAISELIDRGEGRPHQSIGLEDSHSDPIAELLKEMKEAHRRLPKEDNEEETIQ